MNIDAHVHPVLIKEVIAKQPELLRHVNKDFNLRTSPQPLETLTRQMDIAEVDLAVLLAIDCEATRGCKLPSNEVVAELVGKHPERFIGFAGVDPNKGGGALEDLDRAVKELGLKGLKLVPFLHELYPNDRKIYPVYEKAAELKIPVLIHTGVSWTPGARLKYSNPLLIDDVAVDFPELKIIIAHFGWPWVWEAATLAMRHPNVYIDTANTYTGTPTEHMRLLTKLIPASVIERFLADKIIFGSDFPRIEVDKMASAVRRMPLSEEVRRKILGENMFKLLHLRS